MESSYEISSGHHGQTENGHITHKPSMKVALPWLDLKVFYVRVSKCEIDDSTPESLTLSHVPLDPDTLLEVNGVRTSLYSDGATTLLRRDRLDKKSEEVTFVSTDSIRFTGSVKFEVFDRDVLVLSGALEPVSGGGGQRSWVMDCESAMPGCTGVFRGKHPLGSPDSSPTIEVYITGSFCGTPVILTKTLQLSLRKKQSRKALLDSIPEYGDASEEDMSEAPPSRLALPSREYEYEKPEMEEYEIYSDMAYMDGEDGELTWFNAGVRVGVGIGLSVCLGIGIGVGILVKTYQGTARSFRRRLL